MNTIALRTPAALVAPINKEHQLVESHKHNTIQHAIRCGELLTEAKDKVAHGDWLPWLAKNFEGSERTAQTYMKLAGSKYADSADLEDTSIDRALKALAAPEPKEPVEKPNLNTAEGRMLANAHAKDAPIVDGEIVELPRPGLSDTDKRKWGSAVSKLDVVRRCISEASDPDLAQPSAVDALDEASRTARQVAIDLEQLAATLRREAA